MNNFIKVKDNTWLNISNIVSIEYYPDGDGIFGFVEAYYLIICTLEPNEPYCVYDDKSEALAVIEKLKQHGVVLE